MSQLVRIAIYNIPNTLSNQEAANRVRYPGHTSRKCGRGARALPRPFFWRDTGNIGYQGGEYQDLPLTKASRFNMYLSPTQFSSDTPNDFTRYDYVGVTEDGAKLRVRARA